MSKETVLLTSMVEEEVESSIPGAHVVRFSLGGEAQMTAIVSAVAFEFAEADGWREIEQQLRERVGERVTLAVLGENYFGAKMLLAREGTLFEGSTGALALMPKGARKKGIRIDPERVLAYVDGWNTPELAERVEQVRARFPELRKLTRERLLELPRTKLGKSPDCTLCVFGTWQTPEGTATDAVWLIGEYEPEDDIVDGCVLLIRPRFGVSEHGSVFGRELLNAAVGEVVGFEPITFREALALTEIDHDEALDRLFKREPAQTSS
jgi:hypothetical protein